MTPRILPVAALSLAAGSALAGPTEGVVRAGAATISGTTTATTITQTSDRAVIDWSSFSIAAGESVAFNQPGPQSATLNRVTGSQFSSLQGTLTANGQVYLVNPNGILIGNGASISASSFVASTANVGTDTFMATPATANGRYAFNELTTAAQTGSIINAGAITVADGGLVALVAPSVRNSGTITARLGTIELASARLFTLDLFGDDLIRLAVDDSIASAMTDVQGNAVTSQVNVGGQLSADGGRIVLLAVPAAAGVVGNAINLSGIARAQSVGANSRGEITLLASGGTIGISGIADATAPAAGVVAGTITAIGSEVSVTGTGRVNASGAGGGGFVTLGGRLTEGPATIDTAVTTIDSGALVAACGTIACADDGTGGTGNGGTVRLYSGGRTRLAGRVDVSSADNAVAGEAEILSNSGPVEMPSTAELIGRSGTNQLAGFAVIIGETLAIDPNALVDMRDYAGVAQQSGPHVLASGDPASPVSRPYIVEPNPNDFRQTDNSVLFHAYADGGLSGYENAIRLLPRILATGPETPAGTLRPNGGAPMTLASGAADALAPIPVVLTPPPLPPGAGVQSVRTQVSQTAGSLARDRPSNEEPKNDASVEGSDGSGMPIVSGGPGVARSVDLGRSAGVNGASPDVFGVNYHVLAPARNQNDAPVADYLCKTPHSRNGCTAKTKSAQRN